MRYMNTYDIENALATALTVGETSNLTHGVHVLIRLHNWTNRNSDGWAYWPKPVRAAARLIELIEGVDRWDPEDVSSADLKRALVPIKSFLTRQGVDHSEVLV